MSQRGQATKQHQGRSKAEAGCSRQVGGARAGCRTGCGRSSAFIALAVRGPGDPAPVPGAPERNFRTSDSRFKGGKVQGVFGAWERVQ